MILGTSRNQPRCDKEPSIEMLGFLCVKRHVKLGFEASICPFVMCSRLDPLVLGLDTGLDILIRDQVCLSIYKERRCINQKTNKNNINLLSQPLSPINALVVLPPMSENTQGFLTFCVKASSIAGLTHLSILDNPKIQL